MIRKLKTWNLLFLLFAAAVVVFYIFCGKQLVESLYHGKASSGLIQLVDLVYPRFSTEKSRLPLEFFLDKSQQVVIRIGLVTIAVLGAMLLSNMSQGFSEKLKSFSEEKTTLFNINFLKFLFYFLLILATRSVYEDLKALDHLKEFYKPIFLLKIFHLPFPAKRAAFLIYALIFGSSIMVIFGIKPVLFSVLAALGFITYQSYLYSFEKIDHGNAPLTYATMLFPFLLMERNAARKNALTDFSSWSLKLIMIMVALVYFLSGLEKLLISGFEWITGDSFRAFLYLHQTPIGEQVAQIRWLCILLPLWALLFQLSFPLVLFFKKLIPPLLICGVIFHFGTVILFGISSFENPWLFTYIFFVDWSALGKYISRLPAYFRS